MKQNYTTVSILGSNHKYWFILSIIKFDRIDMLLTQAIFVEFDMTRHLPERCKLLLILYLLSIS